MTGALKVYPVCKGWVQKITNNLESCWTHEKRESGCCRLVGALRPGVWAEATVASSAAGSTAGFGLNPEAGTHPGHSSSASTATRTLSGGKEKPDHESWADGPRPRLLWPDEQPQL